MSISRCCTCGYEWETGRDGSHFCSDRRAKTIKQLRDENAELAEQLSQERKLLKSLRSVQLGGSALNEAAWKVVEALPECPPVVFNNLKPALRAGIEYYVNTTIDDLYASRALLRQETPGK